MSLSSQLLPHVQLHQRAAHSWEQARIDAHRALKRADPLTAIKPNVTLVV